MTLLAPVIANSAVIYVNSAATGANNGTSWTNAYTHLQSALAAANASDEIWVAQGVYKPGHPGESRTNTFMINDDVSLYGGFAGGETHLSQRDWSNHVTVLSGDLAGNDTTDVHGVVMDWSDIVGSDNCYEVVTPWNVICVIDGFTITGGLEDPSDERCLPNQCGAGILAAWGDLTLRNAVLRGNYGNARPGGAIYFWEGGGTVSNVQFIGNAGCQGGAVHVRLCAVRFDNVLFRDNHAQDLTGQSGTALVGAGGLFVSGSGNVVVNSQFISNSVVNDGGGLYAFNGMTVSNVLFQGNTAPGTGGGMYDEQGSQLTDVQFLDNWGGYGGGGLYNQGGGGVHTRILFQGNSSTMGGGVCSFQGDMMFINCRFLSNHAGEYGGGFWGQNTTPTFIDSVFQGNICNTDQSWHMGGGMFFGVGAHGTLIGVTVCSNVNGGVLGYDPPTDYGTSFDIRNSIIWGNTRANLNVTNVTARYSIIGASQSVWRCDHVFNVNPQFADAAHGNLHLLPTSPAIDAGDNLVTNPVLRPTDLDGNARCVDITFVTNTGNGASPFVDMGAYEAQMGPFVIALNKGPEGGGATSGGGSYSFGATVTVAAVHADDYRFVNWCEGAQEMCCMTAYTFIATAPQTLMAVFDPILTSNNVSTAWYRSYGLGPTTGAAWTPAQWAAFDGVSSSGNGTPNWNAYYADLNPTNPASKFMVTAFSSAGPMQVYFTPSSTGRIYTLEYCTSPSAGAWKEVSGQVDIPGGTNCLSDDTTKPERFYRLSVELP